MTREKKGTMENENSRLVIVTNRSKVPKKKVK